MIKYTTLVGEYYDINQYTQEDAIVLLNYLDKRDYIEVENVFGQKQSIEIGSILKVSMDNKKDNLKQAETKKYKVVGGNTPL